jgi:hypothetical protein
MGRFCVAAPLHKGAREVERMRNTRAANHLGREVTGWLAREHDRLDAVLAGLLVQTVWGANAELSRELAAYRSGLLAHLRQVERRVFSVLTALDEQAIIFERLEWQSHARDVQQVFAAIDRELRRPDRAKLYENFDNLRRVVRRHRHHEDRLLALLGASSAGVPEMAEAFL